MSAIRNSTGAIGPGKLQCIRSIELPITGSDGRQDDKEMAMSAFREST
jgi:hypothetical protein